MRKIVIGIIVVILIIGACGGICYFSTKDARDYEKASELLNDGKFEEAYTLFEKLDDYKDSKDKYERSYHLYQIVNDKTAPELKGGEESFSVECFEPVNLKDLLKGMDISDNVSPAEKLKVTFTPSECIPEGPDPIKVTIRIKDEADNVAKKEVTLNPKSDYTKDEIEKYTKALNLYNTMRKMSGYPSYPDEMEILGARKITNSTYDCMVAIHFNKPDIHGTNHEYYFYTHGDDATNFLGEDVWNQVGSVDKSGIKDMDWNAILAFGDTKYYKQTIFADSKVDINLNGR